MDKNVCRLCGCESFKTIELGGSNPYSYLRINGIGSINLVCCVNCGLIYLDKEDFNRLSKILSQLED